MSRTYSEGPCDVRLTTVDEHSESRIQDLALKLGAELADMHVRRRSVPAPQDKGRDEVLVSTPAGLWVGWERRGYPANPNTLVGTLHPWSAVGPVTMETSTLYSEQVDKYFTTLALSVPRSSDGLILAAVTYEESEQADGDPSLLTFIQSCLQRSQRAG